MAILQNFLSFYHYKIAEKTKDLFAKDLSEYTFTDLKFTLNSIFQFVVITLLDITKVSIR